MRNLAALIPLAFILSGSFALSTQSVEAKTSQNNSSKAKNFFVPPPPPYTPSIGVSALGMTNAQEVTLGADYVVLGKFFNSQNKHISTRFHGDTSQFVQTNSGIKFTPAVETKIQKHIDDFDSEISNSQKEISKLLNL